ncbi:MAG: 16S rRNA (adenine(1518)-N(6)/adenine(1519)-N(6))-dimethyltransferase RsmA [Bacteroidia bacterium]
MEKVRAKKHLGQHFLTDKNIANNIALALTSHGNYQKVLEIGPGMGVLTQFLLQSEKEIFVVEIDKESVAYLKNHFPKLNHHIIEGDFLKLPIDKLFNEQIAIIGNFPYNISSQILFKVLDHYNQIPELVGMFQKEVAERVAASHGNKSYGILSVILQVYYDIEYLFTVHEHVFSPPPKVKSAVIRLRRKENLPQNLNEKHFKNMVKTAFNHRRKTLRNALKPLLNEENKLKVEPFLNLRAEQLSVEEFIKLAHLLKN